MVDSSNTYSPVQPFWQSIDILLRKPHTINKRLWGCKVWKHFVCKPIGHQWCKPKDLPRLQEVLTDQNLEQYVQLLFNKINLEIDINTEKPIFEVIVAELLPKSICGTQVVQFILLDKQNGAVTFYDITQARQIQTLSPDFTYELKLSDNKIVLNAICDVNNKCYLWLHQTLLPQISKWSQETLSVTTSNSLCKDSLSLVSQDKYYLKYNELKLKYGKDMVKIWPECTDPTKFVYEDVAIATYLLLLWDNDGNGSMKKQNFVDLGCGNGLLVYILTQEGHIGVGIDVRKRNIWDIYPKNVILEERTIVPSDSALFPKTDWIIGNHSDELTPWIPVIAAKSSYNCNFFLLPCCSYNFDGSKYQRKDSSKSQYIDYLGYIKDLCQECGFNVAMDRLKIPSTKRICLVGKGRIYTDEDHNKNCDKIDEIIGNSCSKLNTEENKSWVEDFKPREAVERVKNCTQVDKDLINSLVNKIASYLLADPVQETSWYGGKTIDLSDLIPLIPKEQLKQLKSECGGIQTLLKNNHSIFKVQGGKVQLRYPKTIHEVSNVRSKMTKLKVKQKPCWFYNNHPQGCPLNDAMCSFLHSKR